MDPWHLLDLKLEVHTRPLGNSPSFGKVLSKNCGSGDCNYALSTNIVVHQPCPTLLQKVVILLSNF